MTNGEKFKEMFGVSQVDEGELYAYAWLPNHNAIEIPPEWWNAEYKEPKTGHWILQPSNKEQGERDFIWWKCSECGQVIYSETEKDRQEYHAFCGRCGKRMIEPQESEDEQ